MRDLPMAGTRTGLLRRRRSTVRRGHRRLPAAGRPFPPLILAAALVVAPSVTRAQSETDTADVPRLRAAVKAHADSFPLVLALGTALARAATERSTDWPLRLEARRYLEDALRMRGNDPRPLLELGILMRKQGMRTDALRAMRRAEQRAERGGGLAPQDLAAMHFQMGLAYETRWEDGEHLGTLNPSFGVGSCSGILTHQAAQAAAGAADAHPLLAQYNVACPDVFDAAMAHWEPLDVYETDYVAMVRHFTAALALDPTLTEPAFRLLRHLAAHDAWEEYGEVAEALARRLPEDPAVLLFLGLGYHLTGRAERADSAFTLALERAPAAVRDELLDPAQLLRVNDSATFLALPERRRTVLGDAFWRARDPLFLTPGNERLAEHLARLAYVDVTYGAPQAGIRGRWTPRGSSWLRWGRPLHIRAIRTGDAWGTIFEFWDYGPGPDLIFERRRSYRWSRAEELSAEQLRYLRDRVPDVYAPRHPRFVAGIPFQAAAFRDRGGGAVLEVYGAFPLATIRDSTDAPYLETGVFAVSGDLWEPRAAIRRTRAVAGGDATLDATLSLEAGEYVVSLEAVAGDVAAQRRRRVGIPDFHEGLVLSDLLLADGFGTEEPASQDRAALEPVVSRTLVFQPEAPVGVLWEIYGLRADSLGAVRYRVRAEVATATHENVAIVAPQGGGSTRVEWDGRRLPRADGAIVEHVTLRLPGAKPGSYHVFVTVTDLLTGRSYTAHRPMAIGGP